MENKQVLATPVGRLSSTGRNLDEQASWRRARLCTPAWARLFSEKESEKEEEKEKLAPLRAARSPRASVGERASKAWAQLKFIISGALLP